MVIRDYYCERCGRVEKDIYAGLDETTKMMSCDCQEDMTWHAAVCNGGVGKRYRCNDFPEDPRRYRGQTSYGVEAFDNQDENNLIPGRRIGSDEIIHNAKRFSSEKQKENMDKIYHKTDRERGYAPIRCDLGAK